MAQPEMLPQTGQPQQLRVMICIRNLQAGAGGMERTAANLANDLARRNHSISVVYRVRPGGTSIYNLVDDVERCPCDGSVDSMVEIVGRLQPDVIVYFYATFDEAPHITALCQTGVPLVLHEGSNPDRVINNNWALAKGITSQQAELERLAMMAGCTRLRFTLSQYRDSLPLALRPISVAFPNAFAPADPADLSLRSDIGRKIFLNIGGLKKVKNVMAAVRAFALVANDLPQWDFHIFSSRPKASPILEELERFVAQRRLKNRVKVFDPTPHIGREYSRSHVHVIASKEEGLPNCVAEASRHGLPSIGFACCAGTNSMILNDHNGLLVDCGEGEIPALAKAMRRAATEDEARKRWGANALEESSIYDPECIFAQWEALITEAAADHATPEERLRHRFGQGGEWRRLRAVQRASLGARPWPATRPLSGLSFDDEPPKVTVVVSLFNKEAHVAHTLKTIAACNYPASAKEVIVVDDCSTDASASIASDICTQHGWQLIRRAQNGGRSLARNTGLDAANGEYVHFWDADDLYAPEGLRNVLSAMHENGADIGTGVATREGRILEQYAPSAQDVSGINFARMPESLTTASACFKIYRRDFLQAYKLRFEPNLYMQDSAFNLCAFPLAERIVMTSAILGEYRFFERSSSQQFHSGRFNSALKVEKITHDHYKKYGLHSIDVIRQKHIVGLVFPQFIRRARHDYNLISDYSDISGLNTDFLKEVQCRLFRLSQGLATIRKSSGRVQLAYYAIREGYLTWLPEIFSGTTPTNFRADLLSTTAEESKIIRELTSRLKELG